MKKIPLLITAGVLFIALFVFEFLYMRLAMPSLWGKALFLALLNLNIVALFALMYFVGRSLFMLYMERRHRVLGYRFKTKVVVVFVVLTSIPAVLLFVVASGLGTNFIERLFTAQFIEPVESSIEIAKSLYDMERDRTLKYAKEAASGRVLNAPGYKVLRMEFQPGDASEAQREAFSGKEATEVISGEEGDVVRAAVPLENGQGVVVVDSFIPLSVTKNIEKIKGAYEGLVKFDSMKTPLKANYLLILSFFSLNILFVALWVSMRIARNITGPVQGLVRATEEVAAGNLSVSVSEKSPDEIGLLIDSFNLMVRELKEGKDTLERAYHESDRRRLCMENILESIQSGVISLDEKGNVLTINTSACGILGLKAEDVTGRYYEEILSTIQSDELRKLVKSINIRTFVSLERNISAMLRGRAVILRFSITGLRNQRGQYMGILVVFDDLTDVIKAQKAIAWQEVARRIAHEIKNPLTPIKLSTERLIKKWNENDTDFGSVFERSTTTIIREVESLRRLVDEFSRFGKMPEIKKTPTDIKSIIEEVTALYGEYKGIAVHVNIPDAMPLVPLDGEQFKRVMINIFENAVHAMEKEGGAITISVYTDAGTNMIRIDVADNGPGIREEDKEKLFLPYFSTKKHGTGLGLAIALRIVSEHNGYIRVRDNTPRGSVFAIEVPMKEN